MSRWVAPSVFREPCYLSLFLLYADRDYVRTSTESYDDLGLPSEDPRWEIEAKFHEYLESRFPNVCVWRDIGPVTYT